MVTYFAKGQRKSMKVNFFTYKYVFKIIAICLLTSSSANVLGQNLPSNWDNQFSYATDLGPDLSTGEREKKQTEKVAQKPEVRQEEKGDPEATTKIRRFHEVLDELLAEFSYDVKLGEVKGLSNLAIRKVEVSDAIPNTYKKYLKYLMSERIKRNSRIRLISCIPCTTKTSRMIDGKIVITSPSTNLFELRAAAEQLNIEHFMDIILVYHATHMVLAMQIFKTKTNELVWSRSYNSELIKSKYQKLAIDFNQIKKSRLGDEYVPDYRILFGLGGAGVPNLGGELLDNTMLNLVFRSTEKFDSRRNEFGLMLNIYAALSSLIAEYPKVEGTGITATEEETETADESEDYEVAAQAQPFTYALNLSTIYSRNFIETIESYDSIRLGLHFGGGVLLTTGYLAPTAKLGLDFFFGKRFALSFSGLYIGPSEITLEETAVETQGGIGGEGFVSFNF